MGNHCMFFYKAWIDLHLGLLNWRLYLVFVTPVGQLYLEQENGGVFF